VRGRANSVVAVPDADSRTASPRPMAPAPASTSGGPSACPGIIEVGSFIVPVRIVREPGGKRIAAGVNTAPVPYRHKAPRVCVDSSLEMIVCLSLMISNRGPGLSVAGKQMEMA
jgi:hypothetical protein